MEFSFLAHVFVPIALGLYPGVRLKRRNEKRAVAIGAGVLALGVCMLQGSNILRMLFIDGPRDPNLPIPLLVLALGYFLISAGATCLVASWLPPIDWPDEYK